MYNKLGLILPVLAGIMFGASGVYVRKLTGVGMNSPTVLFTRVFFAMLEMLVFILIYNRKYLKIGLKDIPIFVGTGIIGMMGLNLCYNEAIGRLTLSLAAVLLSTAPVFVIILAAFIFKEKITFKKVACMIMVLFGCVLSSGFLEQTSGLKISGLGVIFGAGSAIFYSLYSVFSRKATDRLYHTYTVIFYSVLFISIVLIPFVDFGVIGGFINEAPGTNILFLLFHSLSTSVLPYIFITLALLHAETGMVSILASGGEPIAAVIFGIIFFLEVPSLLMLVGLIVVIVALAILCMKTGEVKNGKEKSHICSN